jgi:hypothetical protein
MANFNIINPIAQSFLIGEPCFVTKIELFFQSKDNLVPLYFNLRKNENGLPGDYIIPFSEVVLQPNQVSVSSDASLATAFIFESPIYLDSGEYSFTVTSASEKYRLWVSELDTFDIVTKKLITEQPYIGVLFKSKNARTFEPLQNEDVKFNLYIADFSVVDKAVVDFVFDDTSHLTSLEQDPLELFPSSSVMRIYHKNSGLINGSYVKLSGIDNVYPFGNTTISNPFFGVNGNLIENVSFEVSNVTSESYTVILPASSTTVQPVRFGGVAVSAEVDVVYSTLYPVLSRINPNGEIRQFVKTTDNNYAVDSDFVEILDGDTNFSNTKRITSNVNTQNRISNATSFTYRVEMSTGNPYVSPVLDIAQAGIVFARNLIDSPTYDNSTLSFDEVNIASNAQANVYQLSGSVGLLSLSNTADIANIRTVVRGSRLNISGTNPNNGIFRVVDVLEEGANVKIANLNGNVITDANTSNTFSITNGTKFVYEEAATGGSAYSKYITRQINFINPSTSINIRVDINKPGGDLDFYYKTRLVGEQEFLSDKEFVKIENFTIPTTLTDQFIEVNKQLDSLEPFDALILKIVFKGTDTTNVPRLKNLRIVVLE